MFLKFVMAMALIFATVPNAQAATPQDVQKVAEFVQHGKSNGLLLRKKDAASGGTQIVFVFKHIRYSIWYFPNDRKYPTSTSTLSYWVRQEGTSGSNDIPTFSDDGDDGVVDFGVGPGHREKFLYTEHEPMALKSEGVEFRPHWQKQYDKAIADTLAFFKNNL